MSEVTCLCIFEVTKEMTCIKDSVKDIVKRGISPRAQVSACSDEKTENAETMSGMENR